jgi:hypothetical protein
MEIEGPQETVLAEVKTYSAVEDQTVVSSRTAEMTGVTTYSERTRDSTEQMDHDSSLVIQCREAM